MKWTQHDYVIPHDQRVVVPGRLSPSRRWHVSQARTGEWRATWIPMRLGTADLLSGRVADVMAMCDAIDAEIGPVTPDEALWTTSYAIGRLESAIRSIGGPLADRLRSLLASEAR